MDNEPSKWDEATYGPISLEAIRGLFQPESRYRVSWNTHPAGVAFDEWSAAGRRYIISGGCLIRGAEKSWALSAGEFLDLPEGHYRVSVPEECPVELVSVWLCVSSSQSPS